VGTPCLASQEAKKAITGSDFAMEAFQVLPEGELAVKRDSKVSWDLGVGDGGTVDGDRKNLKFPVGALRWWQKFMRTNPWAPLSFSFYKA